MKDKALQARLTAYLRDTNWLFVVELESGPDGMGRHHFSAYWWDTNIGYSCDETGVRGQGFHAVIEEFMERDTSLDGTTLRYVMLDEVPQLEDQLLEAA